MGVSVRLAPPTPILWPAGSRPPQDYAPLVGRTVRFRDVTVDFDLFELRRGGVIVPTQPQVFDVLRYLIEHHDRVVSKEELLDNIWGDRFVSESTLTTRIKSARRVTGDDGTRQEVIQTVHGRGYRFVSSLLDRAPPFDLSTGATDRDATPASRPPARVRP